MERYLEFDKGPPTPEIAVIERPVQEVGGDFVDFFPVGDSQLAFVVGDVCGKGKAAAAVVPSVKYTLRAYAFEDSEPATVLSRTNQALYPEMEVGWVYATLIYGVLNLKSGDVRYINAGHPAPLLYCSTPLEYRWLESNGPGIGMLKHVTYKTETAFLPRGGKIIIVTDGVSEAGRKEHWESDFLEMISNYTAADGMALVDAIFQYAKECAGGTLTDDVSIVAIKRED